MACQQDPHIDSSGHANDVRNNTFIGLRIINETTNLAYYEFTDAWADWNFGAVRTPFMQRKHPLCAPCFAQRALVVQIVHGWV